MAADRLILRPATAADVDAIASVLTRSIRSLTFLPKLHTAEDDRWFVANIMLPECAVTAAETAGEVVGFVARQDKEVRHLYVDPDFFGRGAGSALLQAAKDASDGDLELWCFQENRRARTFYETRGFHPVRFTDGSDNEERQPDVLYRWVRTRGGL